MDYERDGTTWALFGTLFAFGYLNAVLGPTLPYLRETEGISYVVSSLHQVAWAVGGGLAGVLAARGRSRRSRRTIMAAGMTGAGLTGLAVGYGTTPLVTIGGALVMGLLATSALIPMWAALADIHGARRAVAMSEGEVSVSLAGILTPLVMGGLAATALDWSFAFVIGAAAALAAAAALTRTRPPETDRAAAALELRLQPTLLIVFAIVALEFSLSFWLASYLDDDVGLGRNASVAAVSGLYAANLVGRLLASRLARRATAERLLATALATALAGTPFLLTANSATVAAAGIVLLGTGIGALFPLTSALHIQASGRGADAALGEVLTVAAFGQVSGPLAAGAIAQAADLRTGLLVLPAAVLVAALGLRLPAR